MRGLNKVTLIGNLGNDPDYQQLEGNVGVAKFSLATTEAFKDKSGQMHSNTEWHTVILWRSLAELARNYLTKGSLVYIEGKLKTRSFDDKENVERWTTLRYTHVSKKSLKNVKARSTGFSVYAPFALFA